MKWVTLGDESTKFFHANATIKHNKNSIMTLEDENGVLLSQHDEKATLSIQGETRIIRILPHVF
jgi:hypothetical protein